MKRGLDIESIIVITSFGKIDELARTDWSGTK